MIDLNSECWSIAFCLGFLGYRLCSDICSVLLLPQPVCLIYRLILIVLNMVSFRSLNGVEIHYFPF